MKEQIKMVYSILNGNRNVLDNEQFKKDRIDFGLFYLAFRQKIHLYLESLCENARKGAKTQRDFSPLSNLLIIKLSNSTDIFIVF